MSLYIDDNLITGTHSKEIHQTIHLLNSKFALKTLGAVGYFLGFEAFRNAQGIYLTQTKYIVDLLTKTNLLNSKPCDTSICSSVKLSRNSGKPFTDPTLYRSTLGALQYLTYTRPDIAFPVNKLSQFLAAPSDVHWQACKRVLRYLKGTAGIGLLFQPTQQLYIEAFADADWASYLDDMRSTSGCCVFLCSNLITCTLESRGLLHDQAQRQSIGLSLRPQLKFYSCVLSSKSWMLGWLLLQHYGATIQGPAPLPTILSFTSERSILKWSSISFTRR
ncbi:hypothetical protein ACOSQ4_004781 [Xanthoceras sorbifolium]